MYSCYMVGAVYNKTYKKLYKNTMCVKKVRPSKHSIPLVYVTKICDIR